MFHVFMEYFKLQALNILIVIFIYKSSDLFNFPLKYLQYKYWPLTNIIIFKIIINFWVIEGNTNVIPDI